MVKCNFTWIIVRESCFLKNFLKYEYEAGLDKKINSGTPY